MAECSGRNKGSKLCPNHTKKELTFCCETCGGFPICNTCACTDHRGHVFNEIDVEVQLKYNILQDFSSETGSKTIPNMENNVKTVNIEVNQIESSLISEMKNVDVRVNLLKHRLDERRSTIIDGIKEIIKVNRNRAVCFNTLSSNVVKVLTKLVKESKQATKSDNDLLILDSYKELAALEIEIPELGQLKTGHFKPGHDKSINASMGLFKEEIHDLLLLATDIHVTASSKRNELLSSPTKTRILQEPSITSVTNLSFEPYSISRTQNGNLWMCEQNSPYLHVNGQKKKTKLDCSLSDITISPDSDEMYGIVAHSNIIIWIDRGNRRTKELFVIEGITLIT